MADRLLCFSHAGGGPQAFRAWPQRLGRYEIVPVALPGRERRFREPHFERIDQLTAEVLESHGDVLATGAYGVYGHSVGAWYALHTIDAVLRKGMPPPRELFVVAARPPGAPDPDAPLHELTDDRLVEKLRRYGGMSAEELASEELLEFALPIVRADLRLAETSPRDDVAPFTFPVTVVAGHRDASVPVDLLPLWREITEGPFAVEILGSGHFPAIDASQELFSIMGAQTRRGAGA